MSEKKWPEDVGDETSVEVKVNGKWQTGWVGSLRAHPVSHPDSPAVAIARAKLADSQEHLLVLYEALHSANEDHDQLALNQQVRHWRDVVTSDSAWLSDLEATQALALGPEKIVESMTVILEDDSQVHVDRESVDWR